MFTRRAIVGLCMLCALIFSAFAAQSASAATKGTTSFTCVSGASGSSFKTEHCKASDGAGSAFGHVAIAESTKTEGSGSNETTSGAKETFSITSTQAGIAEEIQAKTVHFIFLFTNARNASGEHYWHLFAIIIIFTEMEFTKPAGKGCKVKGGQLTTKELTATTEGQGDFLKFAPATGNTIAEFEVEGCTGSKAIESLNGPYTITGSIKGVPNGATVNFTGAETTAQGTLFIREQKLGLNGPFTLKGRANSTQSYTPLAATTVETP